jgi:hypothetical protein
MRRNLWAAVNRPVGSVASSLQIDEPIVAYLVSGIIGTIVVLGVGAVTRFASDGTVQLHDAGVMAYMGQVIVIWTIFTAAVLVVAAPFVPLATWIGARLRIESVAYYGVAGGLIMTTLLYTLLGPPHRLRPQEFGFMMGLWPMGPPCAAMFGMAWWYLHRRWKSESGYAPR